MDHRIIAEQILLAGIERVRPDRLVTNTITISDNSLNIGELTFPLEIIENIYVIGAGKATGSMASEVEKILGDKISGGHIVVKYGHSCKLKYLDITEAGHPFPDSNGFKATLDILQIAQDAGHNDLVICLLSGGGSALLPDCPEGLSNDDLISLNSILVNSGACIKEINAVRKHLSVVKGGQLARTVYPATLISLILSDVPGDQLDVIASGPTTPDPTTYVQAWSVLENFNLLSAVPKRILEYLQKGVDGEIADTPKEGDPVFERSHNILIGNNRLALEAAGAKAQEFNINSVIIDDELQGDINSIAEYLVETALSFRNDENEIKPVCLLFGGETTVKMTGSGMGGRNQHLALLCSKLLQNVPGITILSAGTDGTDGPTNAAGAVVDSVTMQLADSRNINTEKYLAEFDSYHFFKKVGGHIITGPTLTNVMDIIVIIIQ